MKLSKKKTILKTVSSAIIILTILFLISVVHESTHENICRLYGGIPNRTSFSSVECYGNLTDGQIKDFTILYSQLEIFTFFALSLPFIGFGLLIIYKILP